MFEAWINFVFNGRFKRDPCMEYVGGKEKRFEVDVDFLSNHEWVEMVGSLTEKEMNMLWVEDPLMFGDDKFILIDRGNDDSIYMLIDMMRRYGGIQIYVEHPENNDAEMGAHCENNFIVVNGDNDVTVEGADITGEGLNVTGEGPEIPEECLNGENAVNGEGFVSAENGEGGAPDDRVPAEHSRVVYDAEKEQDISESSDDDDEEKNEVNLDSAMADDSKLLKQVFGNWDEKYEDDIEHFESQYLSDDDDELNEIRDKIKVFNTKWADFKVKVSIVVAGADLSRKSKVGCERNAPTGFPKYDPKCKQVEFHVSQIFQSTEQFKDAIDKYSISQQRPVRVHKNCTEWIRARCRASASGCPWFISLGFDKKTRAYHVKTLVSEHTCGISFKNRRADSAWLADYFLVEIKNMPNITLHGLQNIVKERLGVDITTSTCRRTKLRVFTKVLGSYKEEYGLLCDYAKELKKRNPGSSCELRLDPPPKGSVNPVFNAFYICFDALKKGFLAGCRNIIGVDGCWLKGVCKGELLSAVGRDGNDQMFPLAWAVVKIESTDTWTWFLQKLIDDLEIGDGLGWTIVSDKQKGLKNAINKLLPNVEHRTCARHLYANWGAKFKGPRLEQLFWSAARATNKHDFKKVIEEIKSINPTGCEKLLETSPHQWCKAFFNPMIKCDIVHNNLCEGFNGWILDDRCKPVYSMLEGIRVKCMERLHKQADACAKWPREYGGNIKKKLEKNQQESRSCTCIWGGKKGFEVEENGVKYVVDLDDRVCLCGGWQVTGIPCRHACCAIRFKDLDAAYFLDEFYSRTRVLKTYENRIEPMPTRQFWDREENGIEPAAPATKIGKGRRAKKRRLEALEKVKGNRMSRTGGTVTCSNCGATGHNKKGCKQPSTAKGHPTKSSHKPSQSQPQSQPQTAPSDAIVKRPCTKKKKKVNTQVPIILNPGCPGETIVGMYPSGSKHQITISQLQAKESKKKN